MVSHLGAFVAVSVLVIVTPGPDTALTTRNALLAGRRAGVLTGFGVVTGLLVWSLAAALGVATVVRAYEPAFVTIKIVGACYLVVLGGRALWEAFRPGRGPDGGSVPGAAGSRAEWPTGRG
jgi:threonine/homoserine/homoserine lactone efflux protein